MTRISDYSRFTSFLETNKNIDSDPTRLLQEKNSINGKYVKLITKKNDSGNLEAHFINLGLFDTVKEFCKRLFTFKSDDVFSSDLCEKILSERVKKLTDANAQVGQTAKKVANLNPLEPNVKIYALSDKQIINLDVATLNKDQLRRLFLVDQSWHAEKGKFVYFGENEGERRFSLLSKEQVNSIVEKLDEELLALISNEQLPELDVTQLREKQIQTLFPIYAAMPVSKVRFERLTINQVNQLLSKLDPDRMELLSNKHLAGLDTKQLRGDQIKGLFSSFKSGEFEQKQRFEIFSKNQVNAMFTHLERYHFKLFSNRQIKDLSSQQMETLRGKIDLDTAQKFNQIHS